MSNLTKYHQYRDKIQPGDLISFRGKGIIPGIIRWRTGFKDTHSAMVMCLLGKGREKRLVITESLNFGPTVNYLSDRIEKYNSEIWWYPLYATQEQREAMNLIAWDNLCKQTRYDYGGLFRQALGSVSLDASRLFCSEMVQYYWQEASVIKKYKKAFNPGRLIQEFIGDKIGTGVKLN